MFLYSINNVLVALLSEEDTNVVEANKMMGDLNALFNDFVTCEQIEVGTLEEFKKTYNIQMGKRYKEIEASVRKGYGQG